MNKIKNIFLGLITALVLGVFAPCSFAATGDKFAMKEVKVKDSNTLEISFNKELLQDTSTFEFLLTLKSDDKKEIALTGITLISPTELSVKTLEPLKSGEEYNIVVIFASDKDGNIIENGIDSMITFKVPESFSESGSSSGVVNEPVTGNEPAIGVDSVSSVSNGEGDNTPEDENAPMNSAPVLDSGTASGSTTVESASANTNPTELKTGSEELLILLAAILISLSIMVYLRRKKA